MYVSVRMILLSMCSFPLITSCDGTITITGGNSERNNGEKIEVYGSNRSSISCYITEDCTIPSKFIGPFVGKPANFRVEHVFLNRTIGSVPVAVFKWNPSTSGNDIEDLQGFQLKVSPLLGNEYSENLCRIYDLTNNTFVPDDHKLEFKVTFPGLRTGRKHEHYARLSALPVDDALNVNKQFTLPDVKARKPLAVDWMSEVSHQIHASEDRFNLTLNFTLAPTTFGFRSYNIWLYQDIGHHPQLVGICTAELMKPVRFGDSEDPLNIVRDDATWATVSFRDVGRGQHDVDRFGVVIIPKGDDPCFVYQPSGEKEKRRCKKTRLWFTINKPQTDSTDAKTTTNSIGEHPQDPSQGLQTWAVGTIILGALALMLVGGFFICLKLKKSKSGVSVRKRTVYILSVDDHPCHVTAVQKLATYLERHCHCVIYHQSWFAEEIRKYGVFQWIATHIDKADYTVIINSEAAFKIFKGANNDIKYTAEHHGPETDSVSFALTHVRAKMSNADFFERIIMTYFSYTEEKFLLPFNPGLKYKIPEHLPKLLCNIHKLEYDEVNASAKKFPRMGQLKRNTQGRAVLEAVDNAAQYQLKVPEWFAKLYMIKDNDPIPGINAEDEELTPVDNIWAAYDATAFKCSLPKNLLHALSESTPTIMTNGISLPPSKIAAYDPEELNRQKSSPDMANCFLPPESTYTVNTEEVNQHLGYICLGSLKPESNGVSDQNESNQHLSPGRDQPSQTREKCWLEKESELETLIKHDNVFHDSCQCNVPSDFFVDPESIADSDACTADVETQLLCLNMINTH